MSLLTQLHLPKQGGTETPSVQAWSTNKAKEKRGNSDSTPSAKAGRDRETQSAKAGRLARLATQLPSAKAGRDIEQGGGKGLNSICQSREEARDSTTSSKAGRDIEKGGDKG
jgi:hypothetical protein